MTKTFRIRILRFRSANKKFKIDNLKLPGLPVVAFMLAMSGAVAEAQQPKKIFRIGYLSSFDPASESARAEGMRLALRELGYIEGQNIGIEYRYAEGKRDRFPELADELVRLKVDIILAQVTALIRGGQECEQDDSHRYDGPRS